MSVVLLMLVVWMGVFAILRLALANLPSVIGATAFVALLGGVVAANDHGLWWGQALSLAGSLVLLAVIAATVRPRLG